MKTNCVTSAFCVHLTRFHYSFLNPFLVTQCQLIIQVNTSQDAGKSRTVTDHEKLLKIKLLLLLSQANYLAS